MPCLLVLTTSYPSHEKDPAGVFIANLLKAVQRRGYSVKVVAPTNGLVHGGTTLDGIESFRFGYFWPRSLERLTTGLGGIPENITKSWLAKVQVAPMMSAFVFSSLSKARGVDIIYANWLGAGLVGAILKTLTGKPLVVSFRGDDGYLARDRFLWRVLTKWVIRKADMVAPVSAELMKIMRDLGAPAEKCHLPLFGVDTDMFHPSTGAVSEPGKLSLIFVGALVPKKGLQILFEAMAHPALSKVRLTVVGDGYYAQELKTICEQMGLNERTEWTGLLPPNEVAQAMRTSHVLCLPSFTEGSPNVVKEAMATALPVVASRVGGIPELVREGETGLLFQPGDVEELRRSLLYFVTNPDMVEKMGRAGRELLLDSEMSWDSTAAEFDMIFRRILGSKADPPSNHVGSGKSVC
ncbi:MAG: glycosyltransferase [Desulfomonile tiedjei]|nr:glycosyltransferase [Desulfomonile tiedjei]